MTSSTARTTTDPQPVDTSHLEWVPLAAGLSFKPLTFFADNSGYQLLLRLEPGTVIPRHRHTGEIHAFNVSGTRVLLDTGTEIGPGTYVHEPVGNNDTWMAVGHGPCIVHIESNGRIEYLDDAGEVVRHTDVHTARAEYLAHCAAHGLDVAPGLR